MGKGALETEIRTILDSVIQRSFDLAQDYERDQLQWFWDDAISQLVYLVQDEKKANA